tara:strand:+ start:793 stop:1683 length:891 start_codon:yes stop_codon:yes gene_type:complete
MMSCDCCGATSRLIHQSALDVTAPYVHTKNQTPDPSITTSATAYNRFQLELRKYIDSILREAVLKLGGSGTYSEAMSRVLTESHLRGQLEGEIERQARKIPPFIAQFLTRQAASGYTMGQTLLPSMIAQGLVANEQVQSIIREQMLRLSNQGVITARGTIKQLLGDTLEQGATPREITSRVQDWAKRQGDQDRAVRWRAERIARTEASRALNSGQVVAWEDMGVTRMSWLVAPNPCEFCAAMKGSGSQDIKTPFFTVGSTLSGTKGGKLAIDYADVRTPPLHPNCRCTLRPIVSNR